MSFGLFNVFSTFIQMNDVFKPFIDKFIIIYYDDIIVYNKDKEEHLSHLYEVFQTLRSQKFYANLKKCEFFSINLVFLDFVISNKKVKMDPIKIKVIIG